MDDLQRSNEINLTKNRRTHYRGASKFKRSLPPNEGEDDRECIVEEIHKSVYDEFFNKQIEDKGERYSAYKGFFPRSIRQSGGKDRHSKVLTSRGVLRDRRVRLSVSTAIRFYDVQDKLGFDQPSKAIEWLLDKSQWAFDSLHFNHNLSQSPISKTNIDFDYSKANENFYIEHSNSYKDDSPPSIVSTITSDCSTNSIIAENNYHLDQCNDEVRHNFSSNNYDVIMDKSISNMGSNHLNLSINSFLVDVALQGEGSVVLEGHNVMSTASQRGLIKGMEVEIDEESAMSNRSKMRRNGQTLQGALNTPTPTASASDLQSPIVMINQAYLYCNSPPLLQASYIFNLAKMDESTSTLERANSSS